MKLPYLYLVTAAMLKTSHCTSFIYTLLGQSVGGHWGSQSVGTGAVNRWSQGQSVGGHWGSQSVGTGAVSQWALGRSVCGHWGSQLSIKGNIQWFSLID